MEEATSRWVASVAGAGLAETITLPLDVLKTRLQVRHGSLAALLSRTVQQEGMTALWKGLSPALLRQLAYHPLAMVLYNPIRDQLAATSHRLQLDRLPGSHFGTRLLAGGSAGGLAILVFNWTEVIKTQMQTNTSRGKEGAESIAQVVRRVYSRSGIAGFWAGAKPNLIRTFIVNAAELGTYDEVKTVFFVPYFGDTPISHVGSSGVAGVFSALVSTPVDVIKTRLMNESGNIYSNLSTSTSTTSSTSPTSPTSSSNQAKGIFSRGLQIYRSEGWKALYGGFIPICIRKVIWCSSFFVSFEFFMKSLHHNRLTSS